MEMQGSRHLPVSQQQAWDALNNPQVLKACIPGCEKVEETGVGEFSMTTAVKIGPVAARFNGKISLADVNPPANYTLAFEGQGGAAGFSKGSAKVSLVPEARGCELQYSAQAKVGGKIAQVGQRLIDGVAKSMAEEFFKRFDEEMQRQHPEAYATEAAAVPATPAGTPPVEGQGEMSTWVWLAVGLVALGAYIVFGH